MSEGYYPASRPFQTTPTRSLLHRVNPETGAAEVWMYDMDGAPVQHWTRASRDDEWVQVPLD